MVALGERDCSLQRRNQKVVEETPAPNLPAATRAALLAAAVQLGKRVNYRSAGTVEFIYDAALDAFYFLEVNLACRWSIRLRNPSPGWIWWSACCAWRPMSLSTGRVWRRRRRGPLLRVRIYAESPLKNFQP